ncbi:MAG: TetR/AcrR family transcriptional regulator [Actinomycetota bacterium]
MGSAETAQSSDGRARYLHPINTSDGRRVRGEQRRARVLEAGVVLATTAGLDGFSLDRLAAESGVSKGGVQILFGDKAAVQRAIVAAARREVRTKVLVPAAEADHGIERLLRLGEQWIDHMIDTADNGGCFFCATWSGLPSRPGPLRDLVAEDRTAWLTGLAAMIEHGVAANQIDGDHGSPDELAIVLLGLGLTINGAIQYGDWGPATEAPAVAAARQTWVSAVRRLR